MRLGAVSRRGQLLGDLSITATRTAPPKSPQLPDIGFAYNPQGLLNDPALAAFNPSGGRGGAGQELLPVLPVGHRLEPSALPRKSPLLEECAVSVELGDGLPGEGF